ncbi:hypothetical protein [Streptomyces sp. SID12488]|uniref:hypothetical protein n=1 Tax=Streptomyces sp. SID12488 TaxID=2706040 RepID=UPI0013DD400C|nr:hypothetical protein [Streptomyces sp. SID12488]NEA65367.1 hypothetical protein [Streptomyces sp. SID12488]
MGSQRPRTIEEALARARIFAGSYTSADLESSQQRITEQLLELRWMQALPSPTMVSGGRSAWAPLMLHERAAHDLRALCQGVIHDDDAVHRLAHFDDARDPGGALAFACLLMLADREEGAQFWLQFAAGGGQATGALCLYLLHLRRGEWRDAQHWARQMACLEHEPCQYSPVAHEVVETTSAAGGVTVFIDLPDDQVVVPEAAVKDALEDLDVELIDELGAIPQPSPGLAHQLEDLVTAGR